MHVSHSPRFHDHRSRAFRKERRKDGNPDTKPKFRPMTIEEKVKTANRHANEMGEIFYNVLVHARFNLRGLMLEHGVMNPKGGAKSNKRADAVELKRLHELSELSLKGIVKLSSPLDFLRRVKTDEMRRKVLPAFLMEVAKVLREDEKSRDTYLARSAGALTRLASQITSEKRSEELHKLTDAVFIQVVMEQIALPPEQHTSTPELCGAN